MGMSDAELDLRMASTGWYQPSVGIRIESQLRHQPHAVVAGGGVGDGDGADCLTCLETACTPEQDEITVVVELTLRRTASP